jgi:hypothetical protein
MPRLTELYVATRTRNVEDAGTDDSPSLLVSRGAQDLFVVPLDVDSQGLGTGKAALFRIEVADRALDSEDLVLRLLAGGDDAWSPEHVIAWGVVGRLPDLRVVPLGALIDLANPLTPASGGTWLSTDASEGVPEIALRPVGQGRSTTRAWRIIVISATDQYPGFLPGGPGPGGSASDTGTEGPVTLQAGAPGRLLLSYLLPKTPQSDLGQGRANFYITELAAPFGRADCVGGQFTLTISSTDWWVPDYFAVFGLDTPSGQPNVLIPFVHAPEISLERMSTDPSEGWHSNGLPTAQVVTLGPIHPPIVVGGVLGVMAAARSTGGGRTAAEIPVLRIRTNEKGAR